MTTKAPTPSISSGIRTRSMPSPKLTGPFANGRDAQIIDLILIGELEVEYLTKLIARVEKMISRRIRYIHYTSDQWSEEVIQGFEHYPLLIWKKEEQPL